MMVHLNVLCLRGTPSSMHLQTANCHRTSSSGLMKFERVIGIFKYTSLEIKFLWVNTVWSWDHQFLTHLFNRSAKAPRCSVYGTSKGVSKPFRRNVSDVTQRYIWRPFTQRFNLNKQWTSWFRDDATAIGKGKVQCHPTKWCRGFGFSNLTSLCSCSLRTCRNIFATARDHKDEDCKLMPFARLTQGWTA